MSLSRQTEYPHVSYFSFPARSDVRHAPQLHVSRRLIREPTKHLYIRAACKIRALAAQPDFTDAVGRPQRRRQALSTARYAPHRVALAVGQHEAIG